jgi:flagellar biosynthesis protein FliQ
MPTFKTARTRQLLILLAILMSHVLPTVIIGFGFVIPGSCIAGINDHTLGFIASIVGFVVTYTFGVVAAWRFGRAAAEAGA